MYEHKHVRLSKFLHPHKPISSSSSPESINVLLVNYSKCRLIICTVPKPIYSVSALSWNPDVTSSPSQDLANLRNSHLQEVQSVEVSSSSHSLQFPHWTHWLQWSRKERRKCRKPLRRHGDWLQFLVAWKSGKKYHSSVYCLSLLNVLN